MATVPYESYLSFALQRASGAAFARLSMQLVKLKLRVSDAYVLILIQTTPGLSQSEIGRLMGIERSNMATLTARLTRQALIQRNRVDGRSHRITLSITGQRVAQKAKEIMAKHESDLSFGLTARQRLELLQALRLLGALPARR